MQAHNAKQGYKFVKSGYKKYVQIPKNWNYIKLGSIAKIKRGASPRPIADKKYFGNGRGWIRISDVTKSFKYLENTKDHLSKLGELKSVPVNPGDLIMTVEASVGKPIIVNFKACIHDGFIVFFELDPDIHVDFLYYFLKLNESITSVTGQQGPQFNINIEIVSKMMMLKPSFAEQKKIVLILSNIDSLIRQTEKIIEQAQKLKNEVIQKLFSIGIGHTKFKTITLVPKFIEYSIPEEWEVKKLDEISSEIKDGPMGFGLHRYDYVKKGIPLIRIKNLRDLIVTKKDLKYITKEKHEQLKKSQVKHNDIIISKTGVLGTVGIVPPDYGEANLNQALARISLKNQGFVKFVAMFLASNIPQEILHVVGSSRTVQPGLKLSDIKKLKIPLPQKKEQEKIISSIANIDYKLNIHKQEKLYLTNIKKSLMQKLLTGQILLKI